MTEGVSVTDIPLADKLKKGPVQEPKVKFITRPLGRAVGGGIVGAVAGYFLLQGIPGAAVGAILGGYLTRSLWGVVIGGVFGWFFVSGVSGTISGMVVGAMIASDFVGRKGRWLVLATVLTISVVSILAERGRWQQIMHWVTGGG